MVLLDQGSQFHHVRLIFLLVQRFQFLLLDQMVLDFHLRLVVPRVLMDPVALMVHLDHLVLLVHWVLGIQIRHVDLRGQFLL